MEYEKQIRYNDRQMQRYQAYLSKVQKIKRLDKRTKEMTIGDVIKKSILPLAFMVFWFWMTKNNYEGQWADGLVLVGIYCRTSIWNT